jgi:hypothetical protein
MKSRLWAGALAFVWVTPAFSCSICRCGDPTFNALGRTGVSLTGFKLALDWEQVEKSQGEPAEGEFESLTEQRTTFLASYGFSDTLSVFLRVPYSERDLEEHEDGEIERTHTSGLSDPELYGQLRVWASGIDAEVGVRSSLFVVAGVKTPWGENDVKRDGVRLDEHPQLGTGSTDWFAGLSGTHQLSRRSALFGSVQFRATGDNDSGYEYGNIFLANLAYEHKLAPRWDGVLDLNYRTSGRDVIDSSGAHDPNTGGSIAYLTPRILFDVGGGWVLRAAAQVPLGQGGLNGAQDEDPVWNLGITYLFTRRGEQAAGTKAAAARD